MEDIKKINDGGPAFPVPEENRLSDGSYSNEGMSLRDWFAGQMLIGMGVWSPDGISMNHEARAFWAYGQADAMIAARKGGA